MSGGSAGLNWDPGMRAKPPYDRWEDMTKPDSISKPHVINLWTLQRFWGFCGAVMGSSFLHCIPGFLILCADCTAIPGAA
jgi:hypothetical protein